MYPIKVFYRERGQSKRYHVAGFMALYDGVNFAHQIVSGKFRGQENIRITVTHNGSVWATWNCGTGEVI